MATSPETQSLSIAHAVEHLDVAQRIHTVSFWVTVVSALLSVLVALGVPLTTSQTQVILAAVGVIATLFLGSSAVAVSHAKAAVVALQTAQQHSGGAA